MNRMMILAALLASSLCAPVMALNEEQREILYTLNDLGQDFASVPMIAENLDMFMGMLQMNMQITKAQLKKATIQKNKALMNGALLLIGTAILRSLATHASLELIHRIVSKKSFIEAYLTSLSGMVTFGCGAITNVYSGMDVYDAFKAKNELEASLARDKKILRKLEELRNSMPAEQQNFDVQGLMEGAE